MSTSNYLNANQKGAVGLIFILVLIMIAIALGAYLISQKTTFFSDAYSPEEVIIIEKGGDPNQPQSYENPFDEPYENPFDEL